VSVTNDATPHDFVIALRPAGHEAETERGDTA
jgi:hypothetical protein